MTSSSPGGCPATWTGNDGTSSAKRSRKKPRPEVDASAAPAGTRWPPRTSAPRRTPGPTAPVPPRPGGQREPQHERAGRAGPPPPRPGAAARRAAAARARPPPRTPPARPPAAGRRRGSRLPSDGGHGAPIGVSVKRRTISPTAIVTAPTANDGVREPPPRARERRPRAAAVVMAPGGVSGLPCWRASCRSGRTPRCPALLCALALAGCGSQPRAALPPAATLPAAPPPAEPPAGRVVRTDGTAYAPLTTRGRHRRRAHVRASTAARTRVRVLEDGREVAAPAHGARARRGHGRRRRHAGRRPVPCASACSTSSTRARLRRIGRADAGSGPVQVASDGGTYLYVTDAIGGSVLVFYTVGRAAARAPLRAAPANPWAIVHDDAAPPAVGDAGRARTGSRS